MHLHFVQSLEPLQGAGLGQSALSLHLAMREGSLQSPAGSLQPNSSLLTCHTSRGAPRSVLLSTRAVDFDRTWPDVIQGVRRGPDKAFYAPELKRTAAEAVAGAEWFHGHGFYVWTNMWLGGEARRRGRPIVYHPHGFFDPWILERSRRKKQFVHWLFEDRNFAQVRFWRALSSKEAEQIRAAVGSCAKIEVVPNGVDLGEVDGSQSSAVSEEDRTRHSFAHGLSPQTPVPAARHFSWTQRERPKRLLFLSRIHPKKGLDLLVPAWGRLTGDFPDWELLIVGPDEGGYQAGVEQMMVEAGCGGSCRIHPAVSGTEKHALLRTADLFVLPSYSEGFPMAVLEAAAHRVPVVQTTECNFPELTAAGGAWQCTPEAVALEAALREALSAGDAERIDRGARGRKLVETSYTWDQLAARVFEICGE